MSQDPLAVFAESEYASERDDRIEREHGAEHGQGPAQQAELGRELGRRITAATASARSNGGEATVTVDSSGSMTGLHISEHAMRLTASELASIILDTSGRAQAKMARQVIDLVNSIYGPDSLAAAFVGGAYSRQFPQLTEPG